MTKIFLPLVAALAALSNLAYAATPSATFTDSWKDTSVPDSIAAVTDSGAFSFNATLPLEGEVTTSALDANSTFSVTITDPEGNMANVISFTLGNANTLQLGSSGKAIFKNGNPAGSLTLTWSASSLTVAGSIAEDLVGEETNLASFSDGFASDNTFSMSHATNEVSITFDASDNGGGTFNEDTNVVGAFRNTETEQAANSESAGGTIPLETGSLAGSFSGSGTKISFSDTWTASTVKEIPKAPSTLGMFSFTAKLALDGALTTSDLDSNSQFSISIMNPLTSSVGGNSGSIVSGALGDAETLKLGASGSATFPILVMSANPAATNEITEGTVALTWTPTELNISGTASVDLLGAEPDFASTSIGIGASNSFDELVTNAVAVTLDASDNSGGTFNFDTNAVGTVKNVETESPDGVGSTFPLESGSITGSSGSIISLSDTWKDSAVDAGYTASTTGSGSIGISLPLNGLEGITNDTLDISEIATNSQLTFTIGPPGNPSLNFSDSLQDAKKFSATKNGGSATFSSPSKGMLTLTWTKTTISITGSLVFDFLGEEQMYATNSDGLPDTSVISGLYEISLSLTDTNGGVFGFDDPNIPVTGKNVQTVSSGANGNSVMLEAGTISGTADFTPPTVTITAPASGLKVYNSVIQFEGKASDKAGVASIVYYVNNETTNEVEIDADELPTNSISWSVPVDLSQFGTPGPFTVSVFAIDIYGNISTPISHTVQWIVTNSAVVNVLPAGAGTVKGITSHESLDVGNSYSVTTTPSSKNWIFSYWSDDQGDILSSNESFTYIDTDGVLNANYVPNPFTNSTLAGTYTGLYFDAINGVEVRNAGYITVTVTGTGAFSGKLYNADFGASSFTLKGQLSEQSDGSNATVTLPPIELGPHVYAQVILNVATDPVLSDPGAGLLTGFVSTFSSAAETNEPYTAEIQGKLSLYNPNTPAGLYNLLITPVSGDPSQGPGGYSFGTAIVSSNKATAGSVALVLNLADSAITSPISFPTALAQDGSCPLYASLYGGNGIILGWMQFSTDGSPYISASSITWLTAYDYTSHVYSNGFSGTPNIAGALYVPPKAGTNIFGSTASTFEIDLGYSGLSLPDEIDIPATFNPSKSTFAVTDNTDKLGITLTPSTGALSGSFIASPGSKSPFNYKGVVVDSIGYGFYTSTNKETGPVVVSPTVLDDSILAGSRRN